jgi:hypothetical protein
MKISDSRLALEGSSSRVEYTRERAELRVWGRRPPAPAPVARRDRVEISDEARRRRDHEARGVRAADDTDGAGRSECTCGRIHDEKALDQLGGDIRLWVAKLLLERLTGHEVDVFDPRDLACRGHEGDPPPPLPDVPARTPRSEIGVEFDYERVHYEAEEARFEARAVVTTADGRTIALQVAVAMSREHLEKEEIHLRLGAARTKDPLALSLDGGTVALTPAKISFDLDADGTPENVSFVAPGSAWLALDRNGNGQVDDGSELFGPASGDGFADLATLDGDGNGWIDEADAAWGDLGLWERDPDGTDRVRSLAEAGVGAISTASAATQLTQTGPANEVLGATRATGVYLWESGAAGVVQQVDLAI